MKLELDRFRPAALGGPGLVARDEVYVRDALALAATRDDDGPVAPRRRVG